MTDELESLIYIYFVTAERTARSNFAGRGQSRRRSSVSTKVLAEHIVDKISINWTFSLYGVQVEKKDVVEFLFAHLWAVPDDIANASGTRVPSLREPAAKAIAHGLFLALDMEYTRHYTSQDPFDKDSPRFVHRQQNLG